MIKTLAIGVTALGVGVGATLYSTGYLMERAAPAKIVVFAASKDLPGGVALDSGRLSLVELPIDTVPKTAFVFDTAKIPQTLEDARRLENYDNIREIGRPESSQDREMALRRYRAVFGKAFLLTSVSEREILTLGRVSSSPPALQAETPDAAYYALSLGREKKSGDTVLAEDMSVVQVSDPGPDLLMGSLQRMERVRLSLAGFVAVRDLQPGQTVEIGMLVNRRDMSGAPAVSPGAAVRVPAEGRKFVKVESRSLNTLLASGVRRLDLEVLVPVDGLDNMARVERVMTGFDVPKDLEPEVGGAVELELPVAQAAMVAAAQAGGAKLRFRDSSRPRTVFEKALCAGKACYERINSDFFAHGLQSQDPVRFDDDSAPMPEIFDDKPKKP